MAEMIFLSPAPAAEEKRRIRTYDKWCDQFEKHVLGVVVGAVQGKKDDLGDELDRRRLDENTENGHEVALVVGAVSLGTLVRLPDAIRHETGRQSRLNDGDGIKCSDPLL